MSDWRRLRLPSCTAAQSGRPAPLASSWRRQRREMLLPAIFSEVPTRSRVAHSLPALFTVCQQPSRRLNKAHCPRITKVTQHTHIHKHARAESCTCSPPSASWAQVSEYSCPPSAPSRAVSCPGCTCISRRTLIRAAKTGTSSGTSKEPNVQLRADACPECSLRCDAAYGTRSGFPYAEPPARLHNIEVSRFGCAPLR